MNDLFTTSNYKCPHSWEYNFAVEDENKKQHINYKHFPTEYTLVHTDTSLVNLTEEDIEIN